jgi:putative PIN family toxin of toxin-antitoxin system
MFVLDTNVLVAALWSRDGASFLLLQDAIKGSLPIAISVALALEYEAVLSRSAIRNESWASQNELDLILDALFDRAKRVMPIRTQLRPSLPDPDDEMVLECAVQSSADAIVTMNVKDFNRAKSIYRIDVHRPGELVAILRKGHKK